MEVQTDWLAETGESRESGYTTSRDHVVPAPLLYDRLQLEAIQVCHRNETRYSGHVMRSNQHVYM